ncbi:MAG TPA: hypothetical protein DD624_06790 [Alphaproteobacteria bacterium]|nr:hypothetical protein [Alphaproteobacteria bacterium]
MKRFVFALLTLCGCTEISRPVHIASNVPAAIYVDGRLRGATPMTIDVEDGKKIVLKANGYQPAAAEIKKTNKTTRILSTVSTDKPKAEFLLANGKFGVEGFSDNMNEIAFTATSYPVYLVTDLPSEATRVLMPYRVEEYAPQQVFVTLQKRIPNPQEKQAAEIRRFILHAFAPKTAEFTAVLVEMTQLPAGDLTEILAANPTPDAAAAAVVEKWKQEHP